VPALGTARNTITLWTGPDGDGKTYLAQVMALAVSRGDTFLGMPCGQAPVLYVDLENPGYVIQDRMQTLVADGNSPAALRFWGTWLEIDQQPPQSAASSC
jgi:RecA-family ATPase